MTRSGRTPAQTHTRSRSPQPRRTRASGGWKGALQAILRQHNDRHAVKPKAVSLQTQAERASALFRCFHDLRRLGFRLRNPRCLGGRHVQALVADWTAPQPRTRRHPLAPATLQTELSHLRTFAGWIGKPGLVRPATAYVTDPARVARTQVATADRSWTAQPVDAPALIEAIARHDAWVGAQLRLARAFGLRVKEAVMLQPHRAEVPAVAVPDAAGVSCLAVSRGTKGGRLRHVPIDSPEKRSALDAARALVRAEDQALADPTRTLKQNLDRLHNVVRRFGVTRAALGCTPHGLRHGYAAERYTAIARVPPPVRGGPACAPPDDAAARLQVARELGHARIQIAGAYLGARRRTPQSSPRSANDSEVPAVTTK
jgi:integrase